MRAQPIMPSRPQRQHTVITQPRRTAPDHDIAVLERDALRAIGAAQPAEQERGGESERYGDDRLSVIALVAVLMQRQACPRLIAIDEAGVRIEIIEPRLRRRVPSDIEEARRHRRPRASARRILSDVTITAAI